MQFNFNGALKAIIRHENGIWNVMQAAPAELPAQDDVDNFTEVEDNDIGAYLDLVLSEVPDIVAD